MFFLYAILLYGDIVVTYEQPYAFVAFIFYNFTIGFAIGLAVAGHTSYATLLYGISSYLCNSYVYPRLVILYFMYF